MPKMISLTMDCNTLDCLRFAVTSLRDEINDGDLSLDIDMEDDFLTEIGQLEYLISVAEEELKDNA